MSFKKNYAVGQTTGLDYSELSKLDGITTNGKIFSIVFANKNNSSKM